MYVFGSNRVCGGRHVRMNPISPQKDARQHTHSHTNIYAIFIIFACHTM